MEFSSNNRNSVHMRTYSRKEAVVFRKTREEFGGLSNMAAGYPLEVNGLHILTAEALYQACRFPHMPAIQRTIIGQRSPMTAKMKGKPHRRESRPDWDQVRVRLMRWCLRVKLAQNWSKFSQLLLHTGNRLIVEESGKDDFWGAKVVDRKTLVGINALGRLLMELREEIKHCDQESLLVVEPLEIPDFQLDGRAIGTIFGHVDKVIEADDSRQAKVLVPIDSLQRNEASLTVRQTSQGSLFGSPIPSNARVSTLTGATNGLKPYPAYKDSGVPWLGNVPKHWKVERLRNAVRVLVSNVDKHTKEDEVAVRLCNYVDVYKNERITDRLKFMPASASAEEIGRFTLEIRDVIITKDSEEWNDIGVPALVEHSAPDLLCGYHLAILRPRSNVVLGEYLLRALQSPGIASQFYVAANGVTRYGLSHDAIKSVFVPVPSLPEQTAIVHYLNYMDSRIRRYINAKQKLIALLNERKQAIIHQAVTRGLDPNVRLKPSRVEGLGKIPEHWEVRKLKQVCRLEYGDSLPDNIRLHGDIAVYGSNGKIGTHDIGNTSAPCIVIGRKGSFGKVNFSSEEVFAIDTTFFIDERFTNANLRWLYYVLMWARLDSVSKDSAIPGLDRGEAYTKQIMYCSRDEQIRIADYLDRQLASIDGVISQTNQQINLLREYLTRLIADVVTGKLDVQEAAASLPEEADEEPDAFVEAEALNDSEPTTEDDEEVLSGAIDGN